MKLLKNDFNLANVASDSVCIRWSVNTLLAKGIQGLEFAISPAKVPTKWSFMQVGVRQGSLTVRSLNAFSKYRLIVRKEGKNATDVDLDYFTTWPTGNDN